MNQLIICTLKEGRIDSDDRLHLFTGHPRSQSHSVLLSNGNVEITIGKFL